jgi:hypothetical protein
MLAFTLLTLGVAYLETAPFAGTYARAQTRAAVVLRDPPRAGDMKFQQPAWSSASQAHGANGNAQGALLSAAAFALGSAAALGALRRPQVSRPSMLRRAGQVQMAGWQDNYAGDAFREGKPKRSERPGQRGGKSAFDQEMAAQEESYNQKLVIFSVVTTGGFLAFLFFQVLPFLE